MIKSHLLYHLSYTPHPERVPERTPQGGRVLAKTPYPVEGDEMIFQIMPLEWRGTSMRRWTWALISSPKPNITVIIAVPP